MGSIAFPPSHAFSQEAWSRVLQFEVERSVVGLSFVSTRPDATICRKYDLEKGPGDRVTLKFAPYTDTDGITVSQSVFDNAGRIQFRDDQLLIDYLGNPYLLDNQMDQQRVSDDLRRIVYVHQKKFWHRRMETIILNQLGGYLPGNTFRLDPTSPLNLQYAGHNTIPATDANHLTREGGLATDELVAADDTATIDLQTILDLEAKAASKRRLITDAGLDYPIAVGPDGYYDWIIDTQGWLQLGANTTATEFRELKQAEIQGGNKVKGNALYNGFRGMYSRTRIHVSDFVAQGVKTSDSTTQPNVRRSVFLGAGAGAIAYGQGYGEGSHIDWSYERFEHKKLSILTDSVFGFKILRYNSLADVSENYGCLVHSYFSATA